ncbi:hypothetical protein RF11_09231 [Thelohanellus kitauei]|uniref:Uncharacterized protein n=1 Tax=Thelohanellus kitauei TaxID=669202 RepID=A0A0C2NB98_THEKT|nr:hypothetical protein RF11_09231 [Thelohanellus kitauei]
MSSTNIPYNNDFVFEEFNFRNEDWSYYIKRFMIAREIHSIDGVDQATLLKTRNFLLKYIGAKHFTMIIDHSQNDDFKNVTYDMINKLIEGRYVKCTNFAYQRFLFHKDFQDKDEDISQFLGRLRDMSKRCYFIGTLYERLRDQFIIGINNPEIQKELICRFKFSTSEINGVIEFANTLADAETNVENIQQCQTTTVDKFVQHITRQKKYPEQRTESNFRTDNTRSDRVTIINPDITCTRCGNVRHHTQSSCAAQKSTCIMWQTMGHYAKVCLKSGRLKITEVRNSVNIITDDSYSPLYPFVFSIKTDIKVYKLLYELVINVENHDVEMIVGTGASVSCIDRTLWRR